jgi:hypothetical protein
MSYENCNVTVSSSSEAHVDFNMEATMKFESGHTFFIRKFCFPSMPVSDGNFTVLYKENDKRKFKPYPNISSFSGKKQD